MCLGGLLEFFLGNTFPTVVFLSFGAFWLSYGGTLLPQFNAYAAYAPTDATSPAAGLQTTGFNASFGSSSEMKHKTESHPADLRYTGFFTLSMAMLCFVYLICSVRTNIVFVIIFLTLVLSLSLITGAYWALARDYAANAAFAGKLLVVSAI
jgi:uncharacterized protein